MSNIIFLDHWIINGNDFSGSEQREIHECRASSSNERVTGCLHCPCSIPGWWTTSASVQRISIWRIHQSFLEPGIKRQACFGLFQNWPSNCWMNFVLEIWDWWTVWLSTRMASGLRHSAFRVRTSPLLISFEFLFKCMAYGIWIVDIFIWNGFYTLNYK